MAGFFERDLKGGYEQLTALAERIKSSLESGAKLEFVLKGFAPSQGNPEYNKNLTARRINSVMNYFEAYQRGALLPYIKAGTLQISMETLVADASKAPVSDKVPDQVGSTFSVQAAKERRVEIVEVKRSKTSRN